MIFDINEPRSSKSPPVSLKGRASQQPRQTVKNFDNKENNSEDHCNTPIKKLLDQTVVQEVDANLE